MSIPAKPSVANTDLTLLTSWGGQQVPYSSAQKASGYGAGTLLGRNLASTSKNWENAYMVEWLARANNAVDYLGQNTEIYTDTGTANNFILEINSGEAPTAYTDGLKVRFFANAGNTDVSTEACTININSLGVKNVKTPLRENLFYGQINTDQYVELIFDEANDYFILVNAVDAQVDNFNILIGDTFRTPEYFGAKGDGSTDDSDAFNDATTSGYRLIGTKGKTYAIESAINIPAAMEIDLNSSIIKQMTATEDIFKITATTDIERLIIKNGHILNGTASAATNGKGINFSGVGLNLSLANFENLRISECSYSVYMGGSQTIWLSKFSQVESVDSYYNGFYFVPTGTAIPTTLKFERCYVNTVINKNYHGFKINNCYTVSLEQCAVDNAALWGSLTGNCYLNLNQLSGENLDFNKSTSGTFLETSAFRGEGIELNNSSFSFSDDILDLDYSSMSGRRLFYFGSPFKINNVELRTDNNSILRFPSDLDIVYGQSKIANKSRYNQIINKINGFSTLYIVGGRINSLHGDLELTNMPNPTITINQVNGNVIPRQLSMANSAGTPVFGNTTLTSGRDTIINKDCTAGGIIGWGVSTSGTGGTLNSGATTGNITSGQVYLMVNSLTGIDIGVYLTIAGVSGSKRVLYTPSGLLATKVSDDSASGQNILNVASTTNAKVGEYICVGFGTAREEYLLVTATGTGTITTSTNLVNTHTLVDNDDVVNCIELSSTSDATVTAAAVSYTTPVAKSTGNYAS
ncbi:MAG: hypothetical protein PHC75_10860 [Burkholderiales bacterium]|nr:hypothetical protein [Burkholderiales bacterium]